MTDGGLSSPEIGTDHDSSVNGAAFADQMLSTGATEFTYFIQAGEGGPIKIGRAKNPAERLATLQTGNHAELRIVLLADHLTLKEQSLHWRFREHNIRGEWFHPAPPILEMVEAHQNAQRKYRELTKRLSASPQP